MDDSWQPVKHDVSIAMPDLLDLSSLRGNASHLEGETPMPEDKPEPVEEVKFNEEDVKQLTEICGSEHGARKALLASGGNLSEGVDWFFSHASDAGIHDPLPNAAAASGQPSV